MALLSSSDINTILTSKLNSQSFEVISYEELKKSDSAIGFLSFQQKACIKYKIRGKEEELHVFIKKLPLDEYYRNIVLNSGAFKKETVVYHKFLNEFQRKSIGDPIPSCYLGRDDIVVLNDLSKQGFKNVPLLQTFSKDHCIKTFETLSRLHASSLVFEMRSGQKINEYISVLKEETIFTGDDNPTARAVTVGLKALNALKDKYLPQYENELTEKVFNYITNIHKKLGPSIKYPNAFSHSDMWANNIMFRYDNDGQVAEACVLDFQLSSYKPVAYDLLMLLLCCTNKELRDKNQGYLLKHYYNKLSEEMNKEGIELTNLLPWSEFEAMIDEYYPVLLAIAPQFLQFVLMPDEIIQSVMHDEEKWKYYYEENRTGYALKAAEECLEYRTRLVEALAEILEYFKNHKEF